MLKRLAILSVLLATCGNPPPIPGQTTNDGNYSSQNPQKTAGNSESPAQPAPAITVIRKNCDSEAFKNDSDCKAGRQKPSSVEISKFPSASVSIDRNPERDFFDWFAYWGNVLLVGVGIGTLVAVWIQASRMKEHAIELKNVANAALLNAQAVIDSERGWIEVTLKSDLILPEATDPYSLMAFFIFPTVTNKGRTVCKLTRMYINKAFATSPLNLPQTPAYTESPQSSILRQELLMFPGSPLSPLDIGISMVEIDRVRAAKETFYLYGYVLYEINGRPGETSKHTRFCFCYNIPAGFSPLPQGFLMPVGLPEYTSTT